MSSDRTVTVAKHKLIKLFLLIFFFVYFLFSFEIVFFGSSGFIRIKVLCDILKINMRFSMLSLYCCPKLTKEFRKDENNVCCFCHI